MKRILGLDLGTNSIGWALVEIDHEKKSVKIIALGARIIPMNAQDIKDFQNGKPVKSPASERTIKRSTRRLNERYLLRRDRLHLVLNLLGALPEHYKLEIDFERNGKKSGKFSKNTEPKLSYKPTENGKYEFIFMDSYEEMLKDISCENVKNEKKKRIPYDWTLYYLRQKALKEKISLEEFAWLLLSYNQKRGYQKTEVEEINDSNKKIENLELTVEKVEEKQDGKNKYFEISLSGNDKFTYNEYSEIKLTDIGDIKEVRKVSKIDEKGFIKQDSIEFTITDIFTLKVKDVRYEKTGNKNPHKNTIIFTNGWKQEKENKEYTAKYKNIIGNSYDYIVTAKFKKDATFKERNFREPDFSDKSSDWTLLKKKAEKEALLYNSVNNLRDDSGSVKKYISPLIYKSLKNDAKQGKFHRTKIIGGKFQVIDREFYREELKDIINRQRKEYEELDEFETFKKCVKLLYPQNEIHIKNLLKNKDSITHLLVENILLYQRPLKSKKSEIGNCKYEIRHIDSKINKTTGEITEEKKYYHKVASASHPLFQEFRIWDKIHNLKLIQLEQKENEKLETNIDVTSQYFNKETYNQLFKELNNRKGLNQKQFLSFCKKNFKIDTKNFVWNFPEDEEIKGNETRTSFASRFRRCAFTDYTKFLTQEKEQELWHYLYSVNYQERTKNDKASIKNFFKKFFNGYEINESIFNKVVEDFSNYPKFPSKYCAYSEKALKKLLPFIRLNDKQFNGEFDISVFDGDLKAINYDKNKIVNYVKQDKTLSSHQQEEKRQKLYYALWQWLINERVREIIERKKKVDFENDDFTKAIDLNTNLPFTKGLFKAFKDFFKIEDFTNLNLTQASYLVYGRHSELAEAKYWKSPQQIRDEINKELKHNSLNNPIAEKIIREMMQVVADIWEYIGNGDEKYFNEIHIEVARELKKNAKEKEKIFSSQKENKIQNQRLRKLLKEFLAQKPYNAIPNNKDHFERLKVLENSALNQLQYSKDKKEKEKIGRILKESTISKTDFERYKLWIEQGYKSPYTGKMIKLSDLFDGNLYNIDHVLPQALITNNSLSNKVVCEREVNEEKSNNTGRAFILNPSKNKIFCKVHNTEIELLNDGQYVEIVKKQFSGTKKMILLAKEIPSGFTKSQLNTSRHIARKAMELLSHIVREEGEIEFRSKNVLPVTGIITDTLKQAWKLNEVWTELVSHRFKRMNELTKSNLFGNDRISKEGKEYFDCKMDDSILERMDDYNIKRIDHRHHALDALIIALCTKEHVQYINNVNADVKLKNYGKQKQLEAQRKTLKRKIEFSKHSPNIKNPKNKNWFYMLPGEVREKGRDDSSEETIQKKDYYFKGENFRTDYKKMMLSSLEHTLVTFKQHMRVINKNSNKYRNTPEKNKYIKQKPEKPTDKSDKKYNWSIRRSLGKASYYGKVDLGHIVSKQLHKCLEDIYNDTSIIIDKDLKSKIDRIIVQSDNYQDYKKTIKSNFENIKIKLKEFKITKRIILDESFKLEKIHSITDTGIQNILKRHLEKFDTIELPFDEAINYLDATVENPVFEAMAEDNENDFENIDKFIKYLKENDYKFKNQNYSKLNIILSKVKERDFRNEEFIITQHPEEAFTPENIEKMNKPENLKELNCGKHHHPIYKVRYYKGYGKQRKLSNNPDSVKSKQYIITDAGSNLYVGVYERVYTNNKGEEIKERKFDDIRLPELIELLKADIKYRSNPLPLKIFDEQNNEFLHKFTLSPGDLVYVPTEEEMENNYFELKNINYNRIYKFVDGDADVLNFIPFTVANPIWKFHNDKKKLEIYKELKSKEAISISERKLIKDEFGLGSQQTKHQNSINKIQIKSRCWKLEVNRIGQITEFKR